VLVQFSRARHSASRAYERIGLAAIINDHEIHGTGGVAARHGRHSGVALMPAMEPAAVGRAQAFSTWIWDWWPLAPLRRLAGTVRGRSLSGDTSLPSSLNSEQAVEINGIVSSIFGAAARLQSADFPQPVDQEEPVGNG